MTIVPQSCTEVNTGKLYPWPTGHRPPTHFQPSISSWDLTVQITYLSVSWLLTATSPFPCVFRISSSALYIFHSLIKFHYFTLKLSTVCPPSFHFNFCHHPTFFHHFIILRCHTIIPTAFTIPTASTSPHMVFLTSLRVLQGYSGGKMPWFIVSIAVTESTSKDHFSEAGIMEKGLGRYFDKTSIKRSRVKICQTLQSHSKVQISQMETLMERQRNISEWSRNSMLSIEYF